MKFLSYIFLGKLLHKFKDLNNTNEFKNTMLKKFIQGYNNKKIVFNTISLRNNDNDITKISKQTHARSLN